MDEIEVVAELAKFRWSVFGGLLACTVTGTALVITVTLAYVMWMALCSKVPERRERAAWLLCLITRQEHLRQTYPG